MKNIYILFALFLTVFVLPTQTQAADYNLTSTSCIGSAATSSGSFEISGTESQSMAAGDVYSLQVTINNVDNIEIDITASLNARDVLTITDGNGAHSITGNQTLTAPVGVFTIYFNNADSINTSAFSISWEGILSITETITPVACHGEATGVISIITYGTTANWTGPSTYSATGKDISGLYPGDYIVTVTNGGSCSIDNSSVPFTITEPDSPLAFGIPTLTNINCYDQSAGAINILPTGGTAEYTYSWTGSSGGVITTDNTEDQKDLHAGYYEVTVTDDNGCTNAANFTLTEPASAVSINYNSSGSKLDLNCNGDSDGVINTTPAGGSSPYHYKWVASSGGSILTDDIQNQMNLRAGDYTVTVTDNLGCKDSLTKEITEPSAITFNPPGRNDYNGYDITCYNNNDGSLEARPIGGAGSYTYNWSTSAITQTIDNLSPGDYSLTVKDVNNCVSLSSPTYTIIEPYKLELTIPIITNIGCNGGDDGEITVNHTGGVEIYGYSWSSTSATTKTISDLDKDTYTVEVTDGNGCVVNNFASPYSISEPPVLDFGTPTRGTQYNSYDIDCFSNNIGELTAMPTGGTVVGSYTYKWVASNGGIIINDDTQSKISQLCKGDYTVTVTDDNGCTEISSAYDITEPSAFTLSENINKLTLDCAEHTDGYIYVGKSGGVSGYSFSWTSIPDGLISNNINEDQTDLTTGKYTVSATDGNGCPATLPEFEITSPAPISASASKTDIYCYGDNTGAIDITATTGNTSLNYSWTNANITGGARDDEDQTELYAGIYYVEINDNKNCEAVTLTITILEKDPIEVSLDYKTDLKCFGDKNGAINVIATGGNFINYTWSTTDGGTGFIVADTNQTGLTAGTYNVTVNDDKGCDGHNIDIEITEPLELKLLTPSLYDVSSFGASDGKITVNHSGGTGLFTYLWDDASHQSAQQAIALSANINYTVNVTDANGCDTNNLASPYSLSQPNELIGGEIEIGGSNTKYACEGDDRFVFAEKIAALGGEDTPNYTFSWEHSIDNLNWLPIPSSTNSTSFTWNSTIIKSTYIHRNVDDGISQATSNSVFLDYVAKTPLSISNLQAEYCFNSDTVQLIGSPTNSQGTFSGDGIISNTNGIAEFLPNKNDTVSNPIVITYSYLEHGCLSEILKSTIIRPVPDPSFTLPSKILTDSSYIVADAMPLNGVFSGEGVTSDGIIYTNNLLTDTTYGMTYKVSNTYGCYGSITNNTQVIETAGSFYIDAARKIKLDSANNNIFCFDGEPLVIYANPFFSDTKGDFEAPIVDIVGQRGTINPKLFSGNGESKYKVTYNYSGSDGVFTFGAVIMVYDVSKMANITDLNTSYCNYNQEEIINANTLTGTDKGIFSGYGITDNGDATANLNINSASAEIQPIKIKYAYTHGISGCRDSVVKSTTIHNLDALSIKYNNQTCSNSLADTIVGLPRGGDFSGISYNTIITNTNDSVKFVPNANIVGQKIITYAYTNPLTHCVNTLDSVVTIDTIPNLTMEFNMPALGFCYYNDTIDVLGKANAITATSGVFNGKGILNTSQNNGKGLFNPKLAGVGDDNITFTYIDNNGCANTMDFTAKVNALPEVLITGLNADKAYCTNDDNLITLNGSPASGTSIFTINNVNHIGSNAPFIPSDYSTLDTVKLSFYNKDLNGCENTIIEKTTFLELPYPSLKWSSQICSNATADTIVGYPRGGIVSSSVSFIKIDNFTDSIKFTPYTDAVGVNEITYTYTSPLSKCTNYVVEEMRVDSIPNISIELNMPTTGFCNVNDTINIVGKVNKTTTLSGMFFGKGVINTSQNNGKGLFNPKLAGVGDDNITFTYTDINGCTNISGFTAKINALPEVSVSGVSGLYCANWKETVVLDGYPKSGTSAFSIGTKRFDNVTKYNLLIQDNNQNDTLTITYENVDNNGCINVDTTNITIVSLPSSDFSYKNICISDSIRFEYTGGSPTNRIDSFYWEFGSIGTSKNINPTHKFNIAGNTAVKLTVTDTSGCASDTLQMLALENNPIADFSWKFECVNNSGVEFSSVGVEQSTYDYLWEFGDNTTSEEFNPSKKFDKAGAYTIRHTVASNPIISTCKSVIIDTIYIKPNYLINETYDYIESFEEGMGFWIPQKLNTASYSWENGIPKGVIINSAADGLQAYTTNINGNYISNEKSSVVSPCFDFNEAKKPMLSMWIFKQLETDHDGVVLEYTTDAGDNWNVVGEVNEGVNWYNSFNITSEPGLQRGRGWTGSASAWENCRFDLNDLIGKTNVQFRFAFSSDAAVELEGFAFDNIKINERKRRVLIEHFTNSEKSSAITGDNTINILTDSNPLDVINIQYHTSFNSNDVMYRNYPLGSSSREAYYGISAIPYAYFDGVVEFDFADNTPDEIELKRQILADPKFDMSIQTSQNQADVDVVIKIKAKEDIDSEQLQLFIAVVEKAVVLNTSSGELVFKNVLRRFLPNPGGVYIDNNWINGDVSEFKNTYSINDYVIDQDTLIVVAFIQNEITKEVLQAVTNNLGSSGTEISIEPWLSNSEKLDFLIYPNPANSKVYLAFGKKPSENSALSIINQAGKVVYAKNISEGDSSEGICTSQLHEGMYFIRWVNNQQQKVKKLIIVH